jgi:hypothetical protein
LECACPAAATNINQCAPRAGAPADACTDLGQKRWVRSWIDENYLFYRDTSAYVAASPGTREPAGFGGTALAYFAQLTTVANPTKDIFSFTLPTQQANQQFSGAAAAGFGIELTSPSPTGFKVSYTIPGSPAASANIPRGSTLTAINGAPFVLSNGNLLFTRATFDVFFGSAVGGVMSLTFRAPGAAADTTVQLTAANVTPKPMLLKTMLPTTATNGRKVGYVVFNDHIETAQNAMATALGELAADGAQDLVLDLRYNGGGYVFIAAQVAQMIGGSRVANVPVFDKLTYNDKRRNQDFAYPFLNQYLDINTGRFTGPLPAALNLPRVFILTTRDTCSASESIINGLRGTEVGNQGVQVIQIGSTTCGKPYGFAQKDNGLIAHFGIEFQGLNNKGEGGFVNGIAANCPAADDFTRQLGDVQEGMLRAAIIRMNTGACAPAVNFEQAKSETGKGGRLFTSPLQENKIHLKNLKF